MTVPRSQRKTSSMEYIAAAERLATRVFRLAKGLPKRYTFLLAGPLFEHAEEVVYHCRAANMTYVRDRETFERRRRHLEDAEANLLHVETLLGITHLELTEVSEMGNGKPPSDRAYVELADLITELRKLVSGVKRSDTRAYNASKQEAGERPAR